jgi:enoyl-[acyl-carrier protein] reductase I
LAMDIFAHSFVRLAKAAEPLMEKAGGGSLVSMSYHGVNKVIPNYGVMGCARPRWKPPPVTWQRNLVTRTSA